MDTRNTSVPSHAPSAVPDGRRPLRAKARPRVRPSAAHPSGVVHDNARHTTRFTVVGNHLAQHDELSLVAIGLAVHIQSLPAGARVDIKTLANRFPESPERIAGGLRELEAHGYLRRPRERTPAGRIVTRTISCNQPATARHRTTNTPTPTPTRTARPVSLVREAGPERTGPESTRPERTRPAPVRKKRPLPAVPQPSGSSPDLLRAATEVLADVRALDPRLHLSACDTAHLAPGVAAWLERDVEPAAVCHALAGDLPPEGPRRPAALLAYRLVAQLPPPPPFRAPAASEPVRHPLQNCDHCDRAFRAPEPGRCGDCRPAGPEAAPVRAEEPYRTPRADGPVTPAAGVVATGRISSLPASPDSPR
ncbi:helix-turn-helix domain-containing protein [Streptomyces sp. NPDC096310]|uniref:helix-turn-helix domain-containing protein n=1 Tax=Streptomyces sp. NPDC096310 TaxID=3366082 RepID=UPI00382A5EBA